MKKANSTSVKSGIVYLLLLVISTSMLISEKFSNTNNTKGKEGAMKMLSKIKGIGSPIVLVPGGLTGWVSWDPFAEKFSSNRKVIQVQLISVDYGYRNELLPPDYSVQTESRALSETIDELGLTEPFDIVAWSFGAAVTLDYILDHPDKIRSVTLIEPPAFWVLRSKGELDADTKNAIANLQKYHGEITDDMLAEFMGTVGFLQPGQNARELPQWKMWLPYKRSLRNSPAVINNNNDIKKVTQFNKPVLLIKGTGSAKFLHKIIDELGSNFPNSKTFELPGGHAPHIVSTNRFLEILKDFQESVK